MVPGDIVKVGEMPLLGTGKTDYTSARRIAMEMLGLDAAARVGPKAAGPTRHMWAETCGNTDADRKDA